MTTETVGGNCVVCGRRTSHAIRGTGRDEYFECLKCGNRVDAKAFVFDHLDALEGGPPSGPPGRVRARRRKSG